MHARTLSALLALFLVAGCGYFNSLYNANRSFAAAERASRGGDRATAAREYRAAIDRAAVSYRKYPDSRWADDALLLLGRARFALGEYTAAAAAMRTLLEQSADPSLRPLAHAWLGAALAAEHETALALTHLDSATARLAGDSDEAAFARFWRARAGFDAGRIDAAWTDLAAAAANRRMAQDAAFEGLRRAVQARDTVRALDFTRHLAAARYEPALLPRIDSLLRATGHDWSPGLALRASAPLEDVDWPATARDEIALLRAQLAVAAGEHDVAHELAMNVASAVSRGVGSRARHVAAGIRLERAAQPSDLEDIRELLLPAYDDPAALDLMRRVRAAQILLEDGSNPANSLSLFAAAEFLRDDLGARVLARRIFLEFANAQAQSAWAGKAALAAHQIKRDPESDALLERLAANPYVGAARGTSYRSEEIDRAEERLAFGMSGLREEALADAVTRDAVVGRAVAVLDSIRDLARSDSMRISCGALIDTLAIAGIRADSTRSACLRGDTARVRVVLAADTVSLRAPPESDANPRPGRARRASPDTTQH
jgi:hypothetical protein